MLKVTESEQLNNVHDNKVLGKMPVMNNSSITFNGENNILFCEDNVTLVNCNIVFNGNNSVIYLCSSRHAYKLNVTTNHNSSFYVGRNNYFNGVLNAILSEQKHIFIGDDCLFSFGIWLRVADPHLVYDVAEKKRRNLSKSIFLGDHIWIGQSALILKGTHIHSGSIIGALSVVANKKSLPILRGQATPQKSLPKVFFGMVRVFTVGLTNKLLQI
ncbi:MAG: hypothetical protein IJZ88_07960 [Clostridia bacterium]|nr:hypothetical protein [Clostridia bacterium]